MTLKTLTPSPDGTVAPVKTLRLTHKQEQARVILNGPARHVLGVGGSRSGKTFLMVRNIVMRAVKVPETRHGIFRLRQNAVRASIVRDTFPKVMRLCFPDRHYVPHEQEGFVTLGNDSQIWFAGLDDKDRVDKILGMEYATMYFNEASQIPYSSVLVALTRLAQQSSLVQKAYYDLNPGGKKHWTNRQFLLMQDPASRMALPNPEDFAHFRINPEDNRTNLDPAYLRELSMMPTRQRARFYEGVYSDEVDGALWTIETLDELRLDAEAAPNMQRIVVAVDPSGCSGPEDKRSDEIGIVVAGKGEDGRGYVIKDLSGRYGPEEWGRIAVNAWRDYNADRIVAEKNYGGAMVESTIRAVDRNAPVKLIIASRGKSVRAEPVSALYEKKQVYHLGHFPLLEEQMSNFSTAGYLGEKSPDRADANVWALTELLLAPGSTAIIEYYRQAVEDQKRALEEGPHSEQQGVRHYWAR